ncbi:MAG: DnaJ-like protein [Monoraphidium minutum]|nr:MAG: DnaJ-like protein [Monoraphidium minutum]
MSDIANRDEGLKCLDIARQALAGGDAARAEKFALKAQRLYRCQQTDDMVREVAAAASGGAARGGHASPSSGGGDQQQHRGHGHGHGHHRGGQQQQQQQQRDGGAFGEGVEGLRRRGGDAARPAPRPEPEVVDPSVTPEQRQLDYYEILMVVRGADDDEIKRAYRKLALRLHPDKNKAPKAEDAFKAVSRAFSCLSDADKRAHYDRTGYESRDAAATAAAGRGGGGRGPRAGGPFGPMGGGFYGDDIDPEEIFNMFFGAGAFGPQRAYRSHFGNPRYAQRRQAPGQGGAAASQEQQQRGALLGLLQLLPVLLLVFMTLFSGSGDPAYALQRDAKYGHAFETSRLAVPFYVKSGPDFEARYGAPGTHARAVLERQVESEYYEHMHTRCQQERMAQHRMYTWGSREKAKAMAMPGCDELGSLNERLGVGRGQRVGAY